MKLIQLTLIACLAVYVVADPSCPPANDTEIVVYFPHPSDCSKFFTCHWGNLVELSCPAGTFWNDNLKACDLQGNVECSSLPETTSTEPATTTTNQPATTSTTEFQTTTSTTTSPVTSPAPTGKCPEHYDPDHQVYLPHEDCTKYYICTWGGVALEQNCPPHLHWNQYLSYCDYPQQAGCTSTSSPGSQPTETPTTPTSAPSPTPTDLPSTATPAPYPSDNCPEVYDPNHQVYFPHADCAKYYICTYEGNKLEQNCPAGLHWSQKHSYCDRPELAQCTPAKQADDDECPEDYDPEHPTFFPHEQDCERYYVCYDGHLIEHHCSEGLQWNQDAGQCEVAEEAGCDLTTEVPAAVPECPEVEEGEEEQEQPVFFPHEECSKYYVCSNGSPYEMNCPEGTFWNEQETVCGAPESSDCVNDEERRNQPIF